MIGKNILHLACRHHMMEIILCAVFKQCFGGSSGPEAGIFKRFKIGWKNIDTTQYCTGMTNETVVLALEKFDRNGIIQFALNQLQV